MLCDGSEGSVNTAQCQKNQPVTEYAADYPAPLLQEQLISFADGTDQPQEFERFIAERRQSLAAEINRFLDLE